MMIIAATFQVLLFGWIIGAKRGVKEMNRGADLHVPAFIAFVIRFVTPTFLIVILAMWSYSNLPGYLSGMSPEKQGLAAERAVYTSAIEDHCMDADLDADGLTARVTELIGSDGEPVDAASLPTWLQASQDEAKNDRQAASGDANIARLVFVGILLFYIFLVVLSDIACRNRIGRMIRQSESAGAGWETPR